MVKHDWEYQNYRVNGETVRASLEFSPQRRPLGKAQTVFSPPSSTTKGSIRRSIQISCFCRGWSFGRSRGQDGWNVHPEILNDVGTELEQALFFLRLF